MKLDRWSIDCAKRTQIEIVESLTQETIQRIYPYYYPQGAVSFFKEFHNHERILHDIEAGIVYLLWVERNAIGTITVKQNEIHRLFVLPEYQKQGYGSKLMDFAEHQIVKHYSSCRLDSSLPAKKTYHQRGYREIETHNICTENGDFLCYDLMEKQL